MRVTGSVLGSALTVGLLLAPVSSGRQGMAAPAPGVALGLMSRLFRVDPSGAPAFLSGSAGQRIRITRAGADLEAASGGDLRVIRMRVVGAERGPAPIGERPAALRVNYLRGPDPETWVTGLRSFERVRVPAVAPGIDLVYYRRADGSLEYDFHCRPGSRPGELRVEYSGVQPGPDGARVTSGGDLVLRSGSGEIRQRAPSAYQEGARGREGVDARYRVVSRAPGAVTLGYSMGEYDPGRDLVIDPVIVYASYLGGTHADNYPDADIRVSSIGVDAAGCAYVAGTTTSTDFPVTPGAYDSTYGGPIEENHYGDVFVVKISPDGSRLEYATYLGGSQQESARDITVTPAGEVYVTGDTCSADFPRVAPFQDQLRGLCDAFVTRLSAGGDQVLYSTFLGGTGADSGRGVRIAPNGDVCVVGLTFSFDFPVHNAHQPDWSGLGDTFVTRLNPAGSDLVFSTYLGGTTGLDEPSGLGLDRDGQLYVVGTTGGGDTNSFPIRNPIQADFGGGFWDFFVAKYNAAGQLQYATYLGGDGTDYGNGIIVTPDGGALVTGYISSRNFPRSTVQDTAFGRGPRYACVVKIDANGTHLEYTSFLTANLGIGIGLRPDGNVYVVGDADRRSYPVRTEMPTNFLRGTFVARLSPNGTSLVSTSFFLGSAHALAVDGIGNMYLVGDTFLPNFQTANAFQPQMARRCTRREPTPECVEAFVIKISSAIAIGGKMKVTPAKVAFGRVAPGTETVRKQVRIRNAGRGPLIFRVGWVRPPFAVVAPTDEVTLFPREFQDIELSFTPGAAGRYSGFLSLTSTDRARVVHNLQLSAVVR